MARQPRISFVFLQIFSCEGGIQSYVKDVLRAYATNPALPPADVLLLRDGASCDNPFRDSRLTFYYLESPSANLGRLRMALILLWHLLRGRYQRIICGHVRLAPLVAPLCKRFRIPYTVMTYGKEVWAPLPPRQQQALQGADSLWCISRYSRDLACQANDLDPGKAHLLPCAVDGTVFTPGPKSPQLLQQYGLEGSRILMTVARLWSGDIYKGVDVTIRALPQICQRFPEVKYLVIGRGDDQPRLAQLAQDLGVADRVVFAGFVPNDALADHYRLADAYVMPSQEGFGIVYMEAMACGVPVLSGDADGSADPLQDGRMGWRVPHRDPDAVAAACGEILTGTDPRCEGSWLRQETLAQFSPESLQKRLATLI
ncbi:glycosyltransferase [Leptolyngbya sp. PCC 6406]|uniref:glycosyltransferase n=1 Tax=Leptolyngbya sp. PCC 6406 TaxID=1173264 RepID=UPI0002ACEE03|nr:glycosyltransferase [Leptolyngbya sp. PCC 6406]